MKCWPVRSAANAGRLGDRRESREQARSKLVELALIILGELVEDAAAGRCKVKDDRPAVQQVGLPGNPSSILAARRKLNCAVVAKREALGKIADGRGGSGRSGSSSPGRWQGS